MKNILIPMDFSDNGKDALWYTLSFLVDEPANIHLINVIVPIMESVEYTSISSVANKELSDNARKLLKEFIEASKERLAKFPKVKLTSNVMIGPIAPSILSEAEMFKADLIIMGTRGLGKTRMDRFLGSVSADVVQSSKIPVIAVPPGYEFRPIDNIIYASDLKESDAYYIWKLSEIVSPHVAVIQCLHVTDKPEENQEQKLEKFSRFIVESNPTLKTTFHHVNNENIEQAITDFADVHRAEMIVMHQTAKGFWRKLFGSSHSKKMTYYLNMPMLVLKNEK